MYGWFTTKESYKVFLLIIQQTLILSKFIKSVEVNHIIFWLLIPADNPLNLDSKSFNTLIKMTLTDELKIFDYKIKANQAQYNLDREVAELSALSSKELDKYEYLTGEDLGYKLGAVETAKFMYSPLGKVLSEKVQKGKQSKKTDKIVKKGKQDKNLFYNSQHGFVKFRVSVILQNCHLILCTKKWMVFIKRFLCFKNLIHKQKKEDLKEKDNAGDLFNELYYICKERYSEEKNGLNKKDKNKFYYKTLRLADDYEYECEEE